ncbi:MAG: Gfo/Idh/MocA family oxidoreductase [Planctomycetes bacterium]|nr:Gfo/Idh/MocA family oxidoreductase [Planctomycetota bacterium]
MTKVAIIGAGTIFSEHAQAYAQLGVKLAAVVDIDSARAAKVASPYPGALALTSWQEVLDRDDVDIVDICTPPSTHREIAVAALDRGKHVVCEKPLAVHLADADAILAAASKSNGKLLVVHQLRYHPQYQRLKWLVENQHLGKIHLVRVQRYDPPPKHLVAQGVWGRWDLAGGGVLMTKAIHELDLLLWMFGPAKQVQAMMGTFYQPIESEDQLVANVLFQNGMQASLCVTGQGYAGQRNQFDIFGDQTSVDQRATVWSESRATQSALQTSLDQRFPLPVPPATSGWKYFVRRVGWKFGKDFYGHRPLSAHQEILRAYVRSLTDDTPSPVSGNDGRRSMELCTAMYAAALTGQTVTLPIDSTSPYYQGITQDDYRRAGLR